LVGWSFSFRVHWVAGRLLRLLHVVINDNGLLRQLGLIIPIFLLDDRLSVTIARIDPDVGAVVGTDISSGIHPDLGGVVGSNVSAEIGPDLGYDGGAFGTHRNHLGEQSIFFIDSKQPARGSSRQSSHFTFAQTGLRHIGTLVLRVGAESWRRRGVHGGIWGEIAIPRRGTRPIALHTRLGRSCGSKVWPPEGLVSYVPGAGLHPGGV
jgi:hypothetical protein